MEGCYHLVDHFASREEGYQRQIFGSNEARAAAGTVEFIWTVIGEALAACVPAEAIEPSTTLDMPAAAPKRLTREAERAATKKVYG